MIGILGLIPTILTTLTGLGTTASSISKDLRDKEIAREQTKSNIELKKIDGEIQALHDRKDVLVSEAGTRINQIMRAAIAFMTLPLLAKLLVYDKVIGPFFGCSGHIAQTRDWCGKYLTDPIDPAQWGVVVSVIGFYFVSTSFGKK